MAQKFIITNSGYFRFGDVRLHHDLLKYGDHCFGGGFYEFDYSSGRMLLSGKSYDYGRPLWDWIDELLVPDSLEGLELVYEDVPVRDFVKIRYISE